MLRNQYIHRLLWLLVRLIAQPLEERQPSRVEGGVCLPHLLRRACGDREHLVLPEAPASGPSGKTAPRQNQYRSTAYRRQNGALLSAKPKRKKHHSITPFFYRYVWGGANIHTNGKRAVGQ